MHMFAKLGWWIVVAWLMFCLILLFFICVYLIDLEIRFEMQVICEHFVRMWMHMLAKPGWWIVVACLWFVKAGGFI